MNKHEGPRRLQTAEYHSWAYRYIPLTVRLSVSENKLSERAGAPLTPSTHFLKCNIQKYFVNKSIKYFEKEAKEGKTAIGLDFFFFFLLFSCSFMSSSFATTWTVARQASLSIGFSMKNTGVGCHFLLQMDFLKFNLNYYPPY